jgi:[ribosomal protein S18]-alanine N-acetyltransferase
VNTLLSVRFRDAQASDLTSLVRLDALCFSPEMRYSTEVMRFFAFHRNSRAIVAVDEEESILAFVIVHILRTGLGEVVTLDVTPRARRHKLGEALMERGEGWLQERGARGIYLEVDEDNAPAIALYEKFGYQVRHPFYEDGKRRLMMEKAL